MINDMIVYRVCFLKLGDGFGGICFMYCFIKICYSELSLIKI